MQVVFKFVPLVVSASSDRTIKAWRPYSENSKTVHTIGTHTDYAKCLTYASQPGWVASGGLDKKINIWDISQSKAVVSIDAGPSNHYADGTNESSKQFCPLWSFSFVLFFFG